MSERSRYQRDRSSTREPSDQFNKSDWHEQQTRTKSSHSVETARDNDAWNQRFSDQDATFHSDQYHQDHQRADEAQRNLGHSSERTRARHDISTMRYEHPANIDPLEQDVWLREKHSRITFNDADLRDIQFTENSDHAKKLTAKIAVLAMIGLIVFLGFSSIPELSPEEIIAADGYEGEQPIKTPFNLASMRDCDAGEECARAMESKVTPVIAPTSQVSARTTSTATQDSSVPVANSIIVASDPVPLPAPLATNQTDPVDGNKRSTIQVFEIAATDSAFSTRNITTNSSSANVNDRLTVLQQWSNVRGTPDINGDILVSLAVGKTVTKIGQTGPWIEIQVDERPTVTGYMHRSTVAVR